VERRNIEHYSLEAGSAFVIPSEMDTRCNDPSLNLELLEVTLAGMLDKQAV